MKQAASVATFAGDVKDVAFNRLAPVMGIPNPKAESAEKPVPMEPFPPLFDELRRSLNSINDSLLAIREALSLTEL